MAKWQAYLQITGAPLTNDDAPGVTPPADARCFTALGTTSQVLVQLLDGTSATATVWTSADNGTTWAAVAGATGSIGTSIPLALAVVPGQKTFVQLTSIVGAPTNCIVLDFECFPDILQALATRATMSIESATLHADVDGVEGLLAIIRDSALFTVAHDAEVVGSVDGNGNPLTILAKTGGVAGSTVQTVTFTYDANGNEATRVRS